MNRVLAYALAVFVSFLSGCANAEIMNVRDWRPTSAPATLYSRLYIIIKQYRQDAEMCERLSGALRSGLGRLGVSAKVYVESGLALDRAQIASEAQGFGADSTLLVLVAGGIINAIGFESIDYDLLMFDLNTGKRVWSARTRNDGSPLRMGERQDMTADRIVEKLLESRILKRDVRGPQL